MARVSTGRFSLDISGAVTRVEDVPFEALFDELLSGFVGTAAPEIGAEAGFCTIPFTLSAQLLVC